MLDPRSQNELKQAIGDCIDADQGVLEMVRAEIRPLKPGVRRIQPRSTTSISLVGTDGGNNKLQFDPFLIQLIRVVDSSDNEYCLEAISQTTPVASRASASYGDAIKSSKASAAIPRAHGRRRSAPIKCVSP